MYIVLGFKFDGSEPASLTYPTLDEAMQKLRDWVEADEIDTDGPMFCGYGIRIHPVPTGPRNEGQHPIAFAIDDRPPLKFPRG